MDHEEEGPASLPEIRGYLRENGPTKAKVSVDEIIRALPFSDAEIAPSVHDVLRHVRLSAGDRFVHYLCDEGE